MVSPTKKVRPNIFEYHDYRSFLKDWFMYLESTDRTFSLRGLARQAKISVGYLPMVLADHRSLSKDMLDKFAPHLQMTNVEVQHFETLREMVEAPSAEDRTATLARLQKKQAYRNQHPKEFETYHYMSNWFYVAIRELAGVKGFRLNPKWIQSQLREKVLLADVTKALRFLIDHDFIRVVGGKAKFPEKNLQCMGGVYRIALGKFHKEMLNITRDSIDHVASEDRQIVGHTFAFPADRLPELKLILNEALKKVEDLGLTAKSADTVYHVTLAAIPLTQNDKKTETESL
jgi:uncharacterized protein (TIGR02147 family)